MEYMHCKDKLLKQLFDMGILHYLCLTTEGGNICSFLLTFRNLREFEVGSTADLFVIWYIPPSVTTRMMQPSYLASKWYKATNTINTLQTNQITLATYGHQSVLIGYKWGYTVYKCGFVSTYNWYNSGHNCTTCQPKFPHSSLCHAS